MRPPFEIVPQCFHAHGSEFFVRGQTFGFGHVSLASGDVRDGLDEDLLGLAQFLVADGIAVLAITAPPFRL